MRTDKPKKLLQTGLQMLLMGGLMVMLMPWVLVKGLTHPAEQTAFPAGCAVTALSQSLPPGYRVEEADGGISLLTPEQLLIRLAQPALSEIGADADPEMLEEALTLYMVLLHTRALGQIGDRTAGLTPEQLCETAWLTADDLPQTEELSAEELPAETLALLQRAAERAAPYFLSVDSRLVREPLSPESIYAALSGGKTAAELLRESFGEAYQLEKAATE